MKALWELGLTTVIFPDDMVEEAEKWRHHLIEETASYDEH